MVKKLSLAETHPELAAQAVGWDPTTVSAGKHVKLRWRCKSNHEWDADVASRAMAGRGCPYCAGKVAIPGVNDLLTVNPNLASEAFGWDPTRYKAFSNKSMQWICPFDHIWTAKINERSSGNGCPYCSNKAVLAGFNDIGTTHPEIAAQAHGWDPATVTAGSHKKFEWICGLGHIWISAVESRKRGSGCPVCLGQKVQVGFNDFASEFPELAKEALGWDPTTVTRSSGLPKLWKCKRDHSWLAPPSVRTKGSGCPTCAGKFVGVGFNDLATTHPEIAAQAHGWDPATVTAGSHKKFEWICDLDHLWKAAVSSRALAGTGCPFCSGHKVLKGFNDLGTIQPAIAAEAYGWDPSEVVTQSGSIRKWKCNQDHVFSQRVSKRTNGQGCPTCGNKIVLAGFNDLALADPVLAKEAHGWDPTTVTSKSGLKKEWICSKNHIWTATVGDRSNGQGCPTCGNKTVLAGFNDLLTTHPLLASQASGWDPTRFVAGSNIKQDWICKLGHIWKAAINSRVAGVGCPFCANKKLLKGFNDLATTHPELAKQAFGWDPSTLTHGSPKKVQWVCDYGHNWIISPNGRRQGSTGCPVCAGLIIVPGFNDLQTKYPDIARQAVGWDPSLVASLAHDRRKWRCDYGHEWYAVIANRTNGTGCPSCAKSGYDPNKPGWLYLIDHDGLGMYQIGISNYPDDRLANHKGRGWEIIEIRGPMDGHLTQKLEDDCLLALKRRGAMLGRKGSLSGFDGHTEAWNKASLKVSSIKQILDWVYEDESLRT